MAFRPWRAKPGGVVRFHVGEPINVIELTMNSTDRSQWYAKTARMNQAKELSVGANVATIDPKITGVVIEICAWDSDCEPLSVENHGVVAIKTLTHDVEHVALFEWHKHLRIID